MTGSLMSEHFKTPRTPESMPLATSGPVVVPVDEAVSQHLSQVYWDWRAAFDYDSQASPLQHPDFVLTELATDRAGSRLDPVLIRESTDNGPGTFGALVPKSIRTSRAGGIGPGWRLQGLRLAGSRFLGKDLTWQQQYRMLQSATGHATAVGADFLLIEDLEETSPLFQAGQDRASHGCQVFATHEFQPRRYIDFPPTEAEYWRTFSSRSLSKFRRNLKKFGQTRLERVTEIEQLPDFLRAANEISRQSWQSRQFGLRVRNDDAELRQLSALAQHGLLRSYLWWIEGKPAAFAVCNQNAGCFRYEEIAYCAEFGQFSPGRTMLQQIVEDLLRHRSPATLDFGGGDAEYKQQFANRASRSGTIWLVPPGWRARCSLAYLKACRKVRWTARNLIKQSGWGTRARQWVRAARTAPSAVPANEVMTEGTSEINV